MSPVFVTSEPCEENTDGCSCTLYFNEEEDPTVEKVKEHILSEASMGESYPNNMSKWYKSVGPLSLQVDDQFFQVRRCRTQPFKNYVRFQADPMG
jgi:hypothetical protein